MARPRKYPTDAERKEACNKANRDRQARHRRAKIAKRDEVRKIALDFVLNDDVPPYDPSRDNG